MPRKKYQSSILQVKDAKESAKVVALNQTEGILDMGVDKIRDKVIRDVTEKDPHMFAIVKKPIKTVITGFFEDVRVEVKDAVRGVVLKQ
jgi:hypothetical protein